MLSNYEKRKSLINSLKDVNGIKILEVKNSRGVITNIAAIKSIYNPVEYSNYNFGILAITDANFNVKYDFRDLKDLNGEEIQYYQYLNGYSIVDYYDIIKDTLSWRYSKIDNKYIYSHDYLSDFATNNELEKEQTLTDKFKKVVKAFKYLNSYKHYKCEDAELVNGKNLTFLLMGVGAICGALAIGTFIYTGKVTSMTTNLGTILIVLFAIAFANDKYLRKLLLKIFKGMLFLD